MDGRELKQYERWKDEAQHLRAQNQHLERELSTYRPAWYRASRRIDELEQKVGKLAAENKLLKQQVKELTLAARFAGATPASASAPVVKPATTPRRR